jgi:hypothetical protein
VPKLLCLLRQAAVAGHIAVRDEAATVPKHDKLDNYVLDLPANHDHDNTGADVRTVPVAMGADRYQHHQHHF